MSTVPIRLNYLVNTLYGFFDIIAAQASKERLIRLPVLGVILRIRHSRLGVVPSVGVTSCPCKNVIVSKQQQASDTDGFTVDNPRKRNKDNELRICTWNVRSLNRPRAAEQLAGALNCCKANITAIQELR